MLDQNNTNKTIQKGYKCQWLYMLYARAVLTEMERANYASTEKLSWDQWHRHYGHISISVLQTLKQEKLVYGLNIDQFLIPSRSCKACIKAKQTHWPFLLSSGLSMEKHRMERPERS